MSVRQIRRLEPAPRDRWEWATRKATIGAFWLDRDAYDALRRLSPARVIEEDRGVLAGERSRLRPEMMVHFAFADRRACEERFGPMFDRLLAATPERSEIADGFVVEFTDRPNRLYVEPALRSQGFEADAEWLTFGLVDLEGAEGDSLPPATRLVEVAVGDAGALAEASARYGAAPWPEAGLRAALSSGHRAWWLATEEAPRAGFVHIEIKERSRAGVVHDLAVAPEARGRKLGRALLASALAQLRALGALEASARVEVGNAAGVALLLGARFRQRDAGVTYRRPADDEEVRRRFEARRGHAVKFGDWR